MVQPAESRKGLNLASARRANFCSATCWRVLRESKMRPVLVIIEQVGRHKSFEMPLIEDDHVVQQVASATSHPALSNTVLPRTAKGRARWLASHQVGFSATIRKIRARTSLLTPFRPPTRLNLEIPVQYKRNPAPCQFTTLRGVTKTRGFLHPDQNVLNTTQNSLCRAVNRVRGRCACKASSCRRRAKFSRTRSSRERKKLTIHPRRCRSDTIMARIISELSEFSFFAKSFILQVYDVLARHSPLIAPEDFYLVEKKEVLVGAVGIESTNCMEIKEFCGALWPSKVLKATERNR